ncbi:MAG: DNA polymerase [Sphaerochaetaceae bacterium]
MMAQASTVHLNVTDFAAAVAIAQDPSLADCAFVVAKAEAARSVVLAVSRRAWEEGLTPGMPLNTAEHLVRNLRVLAPDPNACEQANRRMEEISKQYAPLVQNDSGGHLYLDLSGTTSLFGPHIDCAVRIRNAIMEQVGIEPTVAVAPNKLVAKVGTRAIRPCGITCIRSGEEAGFLATQDARLLPGVGPAMARIISVAGLREIGELAKLTDGEVLALFGKRGIALRDAARGVDTSTVASGDLSQRTIWRRVDFAEPCLEADLIKSALVSMVEEAGLEMRQALLATQRLRLSLMYADGVRSEAEEHTRQSLLLDTELTALASKVAQKALTRRIRLRGISLFLTDLAPAQREPDLFTPEGPTRLERLQSAVDITRLRFGPMAVTLAAALVHA